ncbi:MAG: double zinc ribbon domain-containing protein [Brevefilum sp.]
MARKTLGFVPLIWKCPFCETQNPGPIKSCTSCGAPQPEDVDFMTVDEEEFNFIKDEALIRMAKAGPDIHCPYCGTRNPGTAELCSHCGGDLSMGGKLRKAGIRVENVSVEEQPPPVHAPTPEKKRSRSFVIFAIIGGIACLAAFVVLMFLILKTDDITGTVTDVAWERSIAIEAYQTVTEQAWWDEVPEDAEVLSCEEEYRTTSDEFQPNATEVCGTPYVEDTGTGVGEVVQDCTYEVYDDYCEYETMAWVVIDTATASGQDLDPYWPSPSLTTQQQLGERDEDYTIIFQADGTQYTYETSNSELFLQAEPESSWVLKVNQFNTVQSIEPAN